MRNFLVISQFEKLRLFEFVALWLPTTDTNSSLLQNIIIYRLEEFYTTNNSTREATSTQHHWPRQLPQLPLRVAAVNSNSRRWSESPRYNQQHNVDAVANPQQHIATSQSATQRRCRGKSTATSAAAATTTTTLWIIIIIKLLLLLQQLLLNTRLVLLYYCCCCFTIMSHNQYFFLLITNNQYDDKCVAADYWCQRVSCRMRKGHHHGRLTAAVGDHQRSLQRQ